MELITTLNNTLIVVFGLIAGSFVSALSYRLPRGLPMLNDRSRCPKCKKKISWYDNIPLFSYIFVRGKCRKCKKKISIRYPLLELSTAILFLLVYLRIDLITANLAWLNKSAFSIAVLLVVITIMIAIFMTDIEQMIIPDKLVFSGLFITIFAMIYLSYGDLYQNLLTGFGMAMFLLVINLLTQGKGMGLGDVKLAILTGTFLGFRMAMTWMLLAFVIGALVGIVLILMKSKSLKSKVAFGPFLVASFIIILLFGNGLGVLFFPF